MVRQQRPHDSHEIAAFLEQVTDRDPVFFVGVVK
jgi:hypothetical protein